MMRTFDSPRATLLAAFAASLLVHATAGVVVGRGFAATLEPIPLAQAPLSVRIENAPEPSLAVGERTVEQASTERTDSPEVFARTPDRDSVESELAPSVTATIRNAPATPPGALAEPRAERFTGDVRVSADPTLARVGWFLENRSHGEFPSEVMQPVRLGEPLHFEYPAAALEAHREGAVVAWLGVGTDGSVTELNIVSGDDDFSLAVADGLARARLLPAISIEDRAIPFYTVLVFDFHIDGDTAPDEAIRASTH